MSAVQAIATGRAPRTAHGYAAHRLLGRARLLPRPVTIGLAGPFARPSRTVVTLAAIVFGAIAVTFAAGLGTSLDRVYNDLNLTPEQVQVNIPGGPASRERGEGRGSGPGCCRAWPRRNGRSRRRCAPSRARCTTWPKPTTTSAPWACPIACP